ncbi:MAG: D-aminoacyl-tRNA deacylase [Corynebacterium sp.]|nr:D-aminoacyl-tRNA deacylase [Corynebacterium sp.]
MRAILTRCAEASVSVDGKVVGEITRPGLCALVGISREDIEQDTAARVELLVRKIAELRILPDEQSASDVDAPVLVISNFTLYGRTAKGRRPSWSDAAPSELAQPVFEQIISGLKARNLEVATGIFGAEMDVKTVNSGPVTVLVEAPGN